MVVKKKRSVHLLCLYNDLNVVDMDIHINITIKISKICLIMEIVMQNGSMILNDQFII